MEDKLSQRSCLNEWVTPSYSPFEANYGRD